jgi:hypothetical protein
LASPFCVFSLFLKQGNRGGEQFTCGSAFLSAREAIKIEIHQRAHFAVIREGRELNKHYMSLPIVIGVKDGYFWIACGKESPVEEPSIA